MTLTSAPCHAVSVDGRSFSYRMPVDMPLIPGDLVVLTTPDGRRMYGQIHAKRVADTGVAIGDGTVLGLITENSEGTALRSLAPEPFSEAVVDAADVALWEQLERTAGATMAVGQARAGTAHLRPAGVNRHTFLCGQSGSGKSYALGVLLERIILDTELPLVILDPNADFVGLGRPRDGASSEEVARLVRSRIEVLRPTHDRADPQRLCVRFGSLSIHAKAAVLQLDPLTDREEYDALLDVAEQLRVRPAEEVVHALTSSPEPTQTRLAQRLRNLGVLDWRVWAAENRSLTERLAEQARVTVLDLSGFDVAQERLVVALDLLDHLWARRTSRMPTMLVIDEAHNVCSANPVTTLERATTERLVQIANEGRKYGLWLLLCTQRPSRISPAVLAQCDNLVLMRMNSRGDLARLQETFGFVPREMLAAAPFFRQGESLMAGGFTAVPTVVRVRDRLTAEGGSDVSVPMAG